MVLKEFIQMRRDRATFAMMVGIPLVQLVLFGFAINSDPKHLPAAIRAADQGPFARTLVAALRNSDYFVLVREAASEAEAQRLLQLGDVQFVINIPEDFSRKLLRGERPTVLIEADATDPAATAPRSRRSARSRTRSSTAISRGRSPACARPGAPWISPSTRTTTRRISRNTTSCPDSWAWCSR